MSDVKPQDGKPIADSPQGTLALLGFMLVAVAQVSNMILARGLAGSVPAFSLAFFRWTIIAVGLAPLALAEIRQGRIPLAKNAWPILAAGFLGMFLCGGPVYIAGISTTAIHIALIMALSPIVVVLLSALLGMERIGPLQLIGMGLALAGALLIISGGHLAALTGSSAASGDLWVVLAMLGWSGYTLLQSRVAARDGDIRSDQNEEAADQLRDCRDPGEEQRSRYAKRVQDGRECFGAAAELGIAVDHEAVSDNEAERQCAPR